MNIRELQLADIPACKDIYKLNNIDISPRWVDFLQNELEAALEPNKFVRPMYFVVEIEHKIVGFAGYSNCGFDVEAFGFLWCNVHPDYKGRGVGKLLVEERIKHVIKDGGKIILSSQRAAVTWHLERFGFENLGDNGEYEGDKYFLMRKKL